MMHYSSAMKRNELLMHDTAWVSLRVIMLSGKNDRKNNTYYIITYI